MRIFRWSLIFLILLTACASFEGSERTDLEEDLYNRKPDYTGYYTSKDRLREFNQTSNQMQDDPFTSGRTKKIAKHLNQMQEVNRSQVVETEDRIIAGVILNNYAPRQMADRIEEKIRSLVGESKEVVVYTDYTYWYRRIDDDATSRARWLGEDIESFFDRFFEIAD